MNKAKDAALKALGLGLRPIPIEPDGSKKPSAKFMWNGTAATLPDKADVESQFASECHLSIQGGKISGNLECIDFDDPSCFEPWKEIVAAYGLGEVLDGCYMQSTPRGGYHVVYRCSAEVPGNTALAKRYAAKEKKARIETRGEGGYFLVCPSNGYRRISGSLSKLPVLGPGQRRILIDAARTFDLAPKMPYTTVGPEGVLKPGKDFDSRNSWHDVLEKYGWQFHHESRGRGYWVRPDKDKNDGISATTNYADTDLLYVFSSSAFPLDEGKTYSKFAVYAFYEHGGNFMQAASELAKKGYGEQTANGVRQQPQKPTEVQNDPERPKQKWKRASEVEVKEVSWLLRRYIPIGEITLIVGNPGEGKSTIAQAICTAVSRGANLFGDEVPEGTSVFLSAEQSVETVSVPRFIKMGANLDNLILPDEVDDEDEPVPFVLDKSGISELRELCLAERPKIVVIDTMTAYIEASRDYNSPNQVREWMRRLTEIARTTPCAVVLLGHLNKNSNAHPLHRILGSIDFVGAARSVLLVGKDPDDETRRGLVQIKSNVGPFGEPRGFVITEDEEFRWTDGQELDAAKMLQSPQVRNADSNRERCEQWIESLFLREDVIDSPPQENGKIGGFTTYLVTECKRKLGVRSFKAQDGNWKWEKAAWPVYRGGD